VRPVAGAAEELPKLFCVTSGGFTQHFSSDTGNHFTSSLLDKHAPVITKLTRRQSPSNPWFTPALRAFRSTDRHPEKLWKHTHSAGD